VSRLLPAALLAAAVAFGATGTASAAPEWDIGAYDKCLKNGMPTLDCCLISGGEWSNGKCQAPPGLEQPSRPSRNPKAEVTLPPHNPTLDGSR
jgi:hypothetical protein